MMRVCDNCLYAFYPSPAPSPMRCRLNPPTPLMCNTEDGIEVKSLHPAVRPDWFCQHFTKASTKALDDPQREQAREAKPRSSEAQRRISDRL